MYNCNHNLRTSSIKIRKTRVNKYHARKTRVNTYHALLFICLFCEKLLFSANVAK